MKLKRGQVEKSLTSDYSRFLRISFARRAKPRGMIADRLSKAGWSWGCVSTVDCEGRTIWIVDAHRDGKRLIVRADEMLTAFLELEAAIRGCGFSRLDNLTRFFQTRRR
jgi:hypothetical protein